MIPSMVILIMIRPVIAVFSAGVLGQSITRPRLRLFRAVVASGDLRFRLLRLRLARLSSVGG